MAVAGLSQPRHERLNLRASEVSPYYRFLNLGPGGNFFAGFLILLRTGTCAIQVSVPIFFTLLVFAIGDVGLDEYPTGNCAVAAEVLRG